MDGKECTQCGVTRPLSEFHRNARAADGLRAACKDCSCAYLRSQYIPRVHEPERMICPQCGESFTRVRKQGRVRIYCSRKCTMAASEDRRLARAASRESRQCACGADVMTRVGTPVCQDCRKD